MNESVAGHDASLDNAKGITTFAMKTIALLLVMLGSFSTAVLLPGVGDLATADMGALTGVVVTDAFSWWRGAAVCVDAGQRIPPHARRRMVPGQTGRAGGGVRGALRYGDVGAVLRYDPRRIRCGGCASR